ncbi:elongation factor 2 [Fusarium heterosporum]|uniref:Elongation factor 2 n=1 Tax=Fusarium heterosporum TaxID=42747 RepID=A0A8H5SXZ2_FUSHE|nr:elongation factor 2 [Fusarium heterosporum]
MDDLYDEFGNFIGEEAGSEEGSEAGVEAGDYIYDDEPDEAPGTTGQELMELDDGASNAIILHEDKQYYPTAEQVYGADVETRVEEEDAQPLTQPIIAPIEQKKFNIEEADLPPVFFDREFMTDLMNFPEQTRNVALAGHLHHGKTAFMDMLVLETHDITDRLERRVGKNRDEQLRYTDVHILERERGLSIKAAPMSLVLPSTKGKSHLVNLIDTPGHVNFVDEVAASFRLVDGVCLVVDVVEGVQINTEQIIKHAVLEDIPLTLVINKMDRLILELKLPPKDAYFKLKHVVEEVNTIITNTVPTKAASKRISPEKGNVLFACTDMGWCFTLPSFAKMYTDAFGDINTDEFAKRLWGDIYYNPKKRNFSRKSLEERSTRSFVHFVLEPIYKIFTHSISDSPEQLRPVLTSLGIELKPSQYKADAKVLLKLVCEQFFGPSTGFVDMIVKHIPSPIETAERLLERYYTGPLDTKVAASMKACDQDGPLVVHITKLFNTADAKSFHSFGRVLSGTVRPGMQVRVLGEGYSLDDEEDMAMANISEVFIGETRYNIPTDGVPAGNLVLLSGVDNSIVKSATILPPKLEDDEDAYIFKPITHFTESVLKVAAEPINPSELPKMLDGLRRIQKSYPLINTKVEESGEHIVLGTGELYMDCVMHDLRRLYADMDIKVSDPVTRFCETVVETSATKCYAITPNKKNKITMVAEQLEKGISNDIESGAVRIRDPIRKTAKFFEEKHGWDKLAARSIWAFGPEETGPNILQDDTLPTEVDKKTLNAVKESIRQGFSWATREGPLCEEPPELGIFMWSICELSTSDFRHLLLAVARFAKDLASSDVGSRRASMVPFVPAIRNTKFKVTDVLLANEAIFRGGGQIIPTSRRACYSSFLMASPRLMEPVYSVSVTGPEDSYMEVYNVLSRRRGHVLSDGPVAGTPLYRVNGLLPVIDSFGFETDLRIKTQGSSMVSLVFDSWSIVPGDPLDREQIIRPLQPASAQATARDFVLKTRKRKGLSEDVSVKTFLEPEFYQNLMESGMLGEM